MAAPRGRAVEDAAFDLGVLRSGVAGDVVVSLPRSGLSSDMSEVRRNVEAGRSSDVFDVG